MKKVLVIAVIILSIISIWIVAMRATAYEKLVDDPMGIYNLVNQYRTDIGLKTLAFNPEMCAFAEQRVEEIQTDYSHAGFEKMVASEEKPFQYVYAGENIDEGSFNAGFSVRRWLQSSSHRENIESINYTDTCVVVKNGYAVQLFASF
jgi:uncharacterized protein YkwD